MSKQQLHNRMDVEAVKKIFKKYETGRLDRATAMKQMKLSEKSFHRWLKRYRKDPDNFSLQVSRDFPSRLSKKEEEQIEQKLKQARDRVVENKDVPLNSYNYSEIQDELARQGIEVSVPTIINRAKEHDCYIEEKQQETVHDETIKTDCVGELLQHDTSVHKWNPFINETWYAITTIDDYSRAILHGDLFRAESSYKHMLDVKKVALNYGLPQKYYVDNHSIFRMVQHKNAVHRTHHKTTDDVDTQWGQILADLGIQVSYAGSAQAKGKVERPYGWAQGKTMRRCAKREIKTYEETRKVFKELINRYNKQWTHSVTNEVPENRFNRAVAEGNTLFRPFFIPDPYTDPKDIFCFRETRRVNSYREISLFSNKIELSSVKPKRKVDIRISKPEDEELTNVRIWHQDELLKETKINKDKIDFNF